MNEKEWLASRSPDSMLEFLRGKASDRKVRLFACACCRSIEGLCNFGWACGAIEIAEKYADGIAVSQIAVTRRELPDDSSCVGGLERELRCAIHGALAPNPWDGAWEAANGAAMHYTINENPVVRESMERFGAWAERMAAYAEILRDLVSPFDHITPDPNWFTSTVVQLASTIYEERAFDLLPILADALMDAGCDSEAILDHCRDTKQVHVRGCWVIDLILSKDR